MNRRRLSLLVLLAAALPAAAAPVRFQGHELYSNRELVEMLGLPDGFAELQAARQEYFIQTGKENVLRVYQSEGYLSVAVGCAPDTARPGGWLCLVDEGPQWVFGDFRFESDDPELLQDRPRRTVRAGDPAEDALLTEELEHYAAFCGWGRPPPRSWTRWNTASTSSSTSPRAAACAWAS